MRVLLRLEAAAAAAALAVIAWRLDPDWRLTAVALILPDLSIAGYALGPRRGAAIYNAAHSYGGPALLAMAAAATEARTVAAVATLWALHIAVDRALGYGLKQASGFRDTHLGRIGRP